MFIFLLKSFFYLYNTFAIRYMQLAVKIGLFLFIVSIAPLIISNSCPSTSIFIKSISFKFNESNIICSISELSLLSKVIVHPLEWLLCCTVLTKPWTEPNALLNNSTFIIWFILPAPPWIIRGIFKFLSIFYNK